MSTETSKRVLYGAVFSGQGSRYRFTEKGEDTPSFPYKDEGSAQQAISVWQNVADTIGGNGYIIRLIVEPDITDAEINEVLGSNAITAWWRDSNNFGGSDGRDNVLSMNIHRTHPAGIGRFIVQAKAAHTLVIG